jgi:hypothetical protein
LLLLSRSDGASRSKRCRVGYASERETKTTQSWCDEFFMGPVG